MEENVLTHLALSLANLPLLVLLLHSVSISLTHPVHLSPKSYPGCPFSQELESDAALRETATGDVCGCHGAWGGEEHLVGGGQGYC